MNVENKDLISKSKRTQLGKDKRRRYYKSIMKTVSKENFTLLESLTKSIEDSILQDSIKISEQRGVDF